MTGLSTKFYSLFYVFCLLVLPFFGKGQAIDEGILATLNVPQAPNLPQNIRNGKSIVLISTPSGTASGVWKKYAEEMQTFFVEQGVDAVAYLSIEELTENPVAQKQLAKDVFATRGIRNLIILSVLDEEGRFLISVGPYNRKWTFFDPKTQFWMREVSELETVWEEMRTLFKSGSYARSNLLVLDRPEYFDMTISFTSRTERFTKLMESQKVAVPMFVPLSADPNIILRFKSDILTKKEDRSETAMSARNSELQALVDNYPFEAELVNFNEKSEDQWLRSGYGFILYYSSGTEKEVKNRLKYKTAKSKSSDVLYKFYLKQLRTSNVYLGREWDAGDSYLQGLDNFINRVRTEFKSND